MFVFLYECLAVIFSCLLIYMDVRQCNVLCNKSQIYLKIYIIIRMLMGVHVCLFIRMFGNVTFLRNISQNPGNKSREQHKSVKLTWRSAQNKMSSKSWKKMLSMKKENFETSILETKFDFWFWDFFSKFRDFFRFSDLFSKSSRFFRFSVFVFKKFKIFRFSKKLLDFQISDFFENVQIFQNFEIFQIFQPNKFKNRGNM